MYLYMRKKVTIFYYIYLLAVYICEHLYLYPLYLIQFIGCLYSLGGVFDGYLVFLISYRKQTDGHTLFHF